MDQSFDDILRDGYCWGEYLLGIDPSGRLRLNRKILAVLMEHGVSRLWRCPDPTAQRFILSPPEHRVTFVGAVKNHFEDPQAFDKAWRLLCSGTDARIDSQPRIAIPVACLDHAGITCPRQVSILGVGYWYEIKAWTPMAGKDRRKGGEH
jgi:DNA-binding transcriptional regulator/RsmH inhibitor MraZ